MTRAYDEEELPLPLLQPRARRRASTVATEAEEDMASRRDYRDLRHTDRTRPATAGALMGLLGGAAGLGVVHALHLTSISQGIARHAASLGLPPDAATPLAYVAAALGGAVVGAVFFVSLTMLVLAISSAYGRGLGVSMAPAILLASAAYAFIVSFQLPLRRRR
jgi:hypothetical protein